MKSAHCRPMGMLRHGITEAVAPPDLGTDGKLIKRLLEQDHKQEDSIVKKKSSPLVSDCFKKVPVVKLKKLKPGRQKRKQNIVKPECGQHSKQGRQDLNDDGKLIKPHITHDSLPPPNKMPLWRKRHLEQDHKQEDSIVKKKSSPLVSDCFMKVPVVKLKKLKLKSGRQNRKRTIVKPERGQHSKQGRQEQKAADGSIDGKLPPSPFAHNELLASDISITNNPHHLQDTKENKVYMSPPKEYSKIPVDQQFFLNIQTKSQEEESAPTHESHRDQHHTQEQVPSPSNIEAHDGVAMSPLAQNEILPPNTDFPRKGDQENIDCASLETICLKQPVVCLMRLNMETKNQWRIFHEIDNEHLQDDVQCIQPEKHKEPCTDDSDSDKFDKQVTSPRNSEAHDGVAPSPLTQNSILPPSTDFLKQLDQQEGDPLNKSCVSLETTCLKQPVVRLKRVNIETKNQWRIIHQSDSEQQPEKQEELCTDDSERDDFDEQVTSPSNSEAHDSVAKSALAQNAILPPNTEFLRQLVDPSLEKVRLKQPVVRLIRLNRETKNQWRSTDEGNSEQHRDNVQCMQHEEQIEQSMDESDSDDFDEQTTCLKQPVVRLKRVNIETKNQWRIIHQSDSEQQPEKQEELCTDDSERDDFDEQVTSPSNSEAHDSVAKSALAQNAILPPNTEFLRQLVEQEGDPSLEKVRLKQPVVRLIRLNRETKNQWRATDEGNSEQHRDNVQCMQHEEQIEQSMDESDSDDFDEQDLKTLSVYELERLKNIRENAKFLKSLKLLKVPSTLCRLPKRRHCVIRAKKKSRGVTRQSVRLQERKLSIIPEEEPVVLKPKPLQFHGPIKMCPANDVNDGAWRSFQETWKSISTVKCVKTSSVKCRKLTSYANKLQSLTLEEKSVAQNVLGSISSLAIHPSKTRTLVAAGDCNGNVGLWDLKHRSAGIYVFPVHSRKTKAVAFSPSDPQHLLSLGFEGTIRCGDVSYSVFDEIYRGEGYASSFDFLSVDGSVLLVSHYDSKLSVVDRRTRNTKASVHGCLDLKCVRSVSVHPLQRDVCVVAGSGGILIYDVRKLRTDTTQPVMSLLGHRNGAVSASFSPATGNCILTSSAGPCLRVFRTECFGKNLNPVKTFRLNKNKHVEHLMPLTWDPKQENCFVHGLMGGGHISILHVKGQHVHTLSSPYLSAKPNALAVHPTRHVVVAGTRTGMLCLWKKWKNQSDPPEENKCLE